MDLVASPEAAKTIKELDEAKPATKKPCGCKLYTCKECFPENFSTTTTNTKIYDNKYKAGDSVLISSFAGGGSGIVESITGEFVSVVRNGAASLLLHVSDIELLREEDELEFPSDDFETADDLIVPNFLNNNSEDDYYDLDVSGEEDISSMIADIMDWQESGIISSNYSRESLYKISDEGIRRIHARLSANVDDDEVLTEEPPSDGESDVQKCDKYIAVCDKYNGGKRPVSRGTFLAMSSDEQGALLAKLQQK
jgi:hypothetical protein